MQIYDQLLGGIGAGIIVGILGFLISPVVGVLLLVGVAVLVAVAMFGYPPTDTPRQHRDA